MLRWRNIFLDNLLTAILYLQTVGFITTSFNGSLCIYTRSSNSSATLSVALEYLCFVFLPQPQLAKLSVKLKNSTQIIVNVNVCQVIGLGLLAIVILLNYWKKFAKEYPECLAQNNNQFSRMVS